MSDEKKGSLSREEIDEGFEKVYNKTIRKQNLRKEIKGLVAEHEPYFEVLGPDTKILITKLKEYLAE